MKFSQPLPAAHSTSLPQGVAILPRKPIDTDFESVPRFYFADHKFLTLAVDVFSLIIPEHERFFIRTLRSCSDTLTDENEKKTLRAFIQQEAMHLKIHDDFNNSRQQYGINVAREKARMSKFFKLVNKWAPLKLRLGMTVFMEHLTASGAHVVTKQKEENVLRFMHPTMASLWQWHAIEEIEHKSVAFDVYKNEKGGYFLRVFSALLVLTTFAIPLFSMIYSVRKDMIAFDKANNLDAKDEPENLIYESAIKDVRKEVKTAFKILFQYFKPSFHPWDLDESKAIQELYDVYGKA